MKAFLKNYRQSPRKVRLVTDLIRGKSVNQAVILLSYVKKRGGMPIKKLVESAASNARKTVTERNNLIVKSIRVDEGFTFKRFQPRARGRSSPIRKRTSNVTVELVERKPEVRSTKPRTSSKSKTSKKKTKVKAKK